jgi:TolA-binding protein
MDKVGKIIFWLFILCAVVGWANKPSEPTNQELLTAVNDLKYYVSELEAKNNKAQEKIDDLESRLEDIEDKLHM